MELCRSKMQLAPPHGNFNGATNPEIVYYKKMAVKHHNQFNKIKQTGKVNIKNSLLASKILHKRDKHSAQIRIFAVGVCDLITRGYR